mgnify:CR=1 FL=1
MELIDQTHKLIQNSTPFALVTIASTKGSSPRSSGSKMIVLEREIIGTIGGGKIEWVIIEESRKLLLRNESHCVLIPYNLSASAGQCCGGKIEVMIETHIPITNDLTIFGNGNVAKVFIQLAAQSNLRINWIDEREIDFPETAPKNVKIKSDDENPTDSVEIIPPQSSVLIMTHRHDLDFEILRKCLIRNDLRYIGMIGSMHKRRNFEQKLKQMGLSSAQLSSFRCPIGMDEWKCKLPYEIALSSLTHLLSTLSKPDPTI